MHTSSLNTSQDLWAELPGLLDRMIAAHEGWLSALTDHKAAIGQANTKAIAGAVDRERGFAELVQTLENERCGLLGIPAAVKTAQGPTITELARTRPPAERDALLERATRLRALIERVRREQSIVREASASVLGHMRGLMAHLASRLSHAGTYGAGGRVEAGPCVVSGLDIRR